MRNKKKVLGIKRDDGSMVYCRITEAEIKLLRTMNKLASVLQVKK